MRVLIVEDEEFLAEAIRARLEMDAIAADVVADGDAALAAVEINDYDVVLLDRDIPGVHGDEVCRRLAENPDSPAVLMLTAAGHLDDRVRGLELGADDYLAKPFEFAELIAAAPEMFAALIAAIEWIEDDRFDDDYISEDWYHAALAAVGMATCGGFSPGKSRVEDE